MPASGHRDEKALNAAIAVAIDRCHPLSKVDAERTNKLMGSAKQPDIVVDTPGRERVLVENKYASVPARVLERQCQGHFKAKWAQDDRSVKVVVGMRSPERLDDFSDADLSQGAFTEIRFQWAMWSAKNGDALTRFPESGWLEGRIAELAAFIDRAGADGSDTGELADLVQMRLTAAASEATQGAGVDEAFGKVLAQEPGEQTNRMAMAVMFNAVLFHFQISRHHPQIPTPAQLMEEIDFSQMRMLDVWREILDINYWPIFGVSRRLLLAISGAGDAKRALEILSRTAMAITDDPNSSGLIGRLFGELIGDRKFLATFYTRPASAALLAELAVTRLKVDWSDPKAVAGIRVGDMACGTGALLTAVYRRIVERHRSEGGDDEDIHRPLIEDAMIGCDIMSAAVHLTAVRLSGERPDIDYARTKTWVMPYGEVADEKGVKAFRIGAFDLQHSDVQAALWGDGTLAVTAQGEQANTAADIPAGSLDIAIMNPPFTRSTNHEARHADVPNPAFAGLGNDPQAQKAMSNALAVSTRRVGGMKAGHGNAGIASNFIDLAHAKLKPGGVLALIVPASLVSGTAWRLARALLAASYRDIAVISIAEHGNETSQGRAFSADTGMAEVIVVATKCERPVRGASLDATYVVLDDRPASSLSGVEIARIIESKNKGAVRLKAGDQIIGWRVDSPFGPDIEGHPSGVSNLEVAAAATELTGGRLVLPRYRILALPISVLDKLGSRGPVHRDISGKNPDGTPRGPFDVLEFADRTLYAQASWPILWSHSHSAEQAMLVEPCSYGADRNGMRDQALEVWEGYTNSTGISIAGATRLHVNSDFRVNSQPMAACLTPDLAIGGRAWPSLHPTPEDVNETENWEKAICVWLNSTLGLLGRWYVSNRQQPGRANLTVTTMGNIPTLDLRAVSAEQARELAAVYNDFERRAMLPANEAYRDDARQELDKRVLCGVLGLPDSVLNPLETLRLQWCSEPSVHGDKKTRP